MNKIDKNSDNQTMKIRLMTAKILLKYLINQLLMQQEILFITSY